MIITGHQVDDAMFHYIASNRDADTYKLLLKDEPQLSFDKSFAILQIECRRKTCNKLSELLQHEHFLFPKEISAEQCTHEIVAKFHSSLLNCNEHVLDMTMGLGIDDYYIAKCVKSLTAIELDPAIAEVGRHNFSILAPNIKVIQGDSVEYLKTLDINKHFDAIFIDPARRGEGGKRLYGFSDCQPDVLSSMPLIRQHCSKLFIKASPMLDVTQSIRDLGNSLTDVWAVSIKNECKELFFKLNFEQNSSDVTFHAFNYDSNMWQRFSTSTNDFKPLISNAPITCNYLYVPNSSIMKLGCYDAVAHTYGAPQIAQDSHLMVSDKVITDFPGRQFHILEIIPFKDREIKHLSKRISQANISTRNFRINTEALKKRLKVSDGGELYIFATTLATSESILILCKKL